MVGIDGQNDPFEICNLRVGYDGTTYVKGLNINGAPVAIEPGTGYLIAGGPAEVWTASTNSLTNNNHSYYI